MFTGRGEPVAEHYAVDSPRTSPYGSLSGSSNTLLVSDPSRKEGFVRCSLSWKRQARVPPLNCHPACPGAPWDRSRGTCDLFSGSNSKTQPIEFDLPIAQLWQPRRLPAADLPG